VLRPTVAAAIEVRPEHTVRAASGRAADGRIQEYLYQESLDDQALDEEGSGVYDLLEVEPVRAGQLLRGVFLGCGTTAIFEEL
jgi:hypothetical protein